MSMAALNQFIQDMNKLEEQYLALENQTGDFKKTLEILLSYVPLFLKSELEKVLPSHIKVETSPHYGEILSILISNPDTQKAVEISFLGTNWAIVVVGIGDGVPLLPNGFSDLSLTEGFNVNIFADRIMAVIS